MSVDHHLLPELLDEETATALVTLVPLVRRVLRGRLRDAQVVDDLTQETLMRVLRARQRLVDMPAYATVVARNLACSHLRVEQRRRLRAHLLDDQSEPVRLGEQLEGDEEAVALGLALARMPEQARNLLLAHHTGGVPLAVLAAQSGTSTGALATSLSRARAVLRVDFLSIYSKDPNHPRCRAVLIALSEGNARRQAALDAPGHLEACCHCATLARRLHHRNLIEREDRA